MARAPPTPAAAPTLGAGGAGHAVRARLPRTLSKSAAFARSTGSCGERDTCCPAARSSHLGPGNVIEQRETGNARHPADRRVGTYRGRPIVMGGSHCLHPETGLTELATALSGRVGRPSDMTVESPCRATPPSEATSTWRCGLRCCRRQGLARHPRCQGHPGCRRRWYRSLCPKS